MKWYEDWLAITFNHADEVGGLIIALLIWGVLIFGIILTISYISNPFLLYGICGLCYILGMVFARLMFNPLEYLTPPPPWLGLICVFWPLLVAFIFLGNIFSLIYYVLTNIKENRVLIFFYEIIEDCIPNFIYYSLTPKNQAFSVDKNLPVTQQQDIINDKLREINEKLQRIEKYEQEQKEKTQDNNNCELKIEL